MPPSNYVAIGILEAEELHSKIVGPQEAEDIYGEGGTDGDETGLVDKGFCWKRFSAKYLRNEGEEVIPHSYDSEDEDGQPGGGDDVYMAGLALHRRGYPPSNNNNQSGKGHYPSSSAFSLLNNHRFSNQRTHATIYSIRNGQAHLGRFVTYSREYQPGEPLDGVFDFSAGKLRCYQVSACLIREEWSYYPVAAKRRLIARAVVDTFYEYASNCLSCAVFLKVPIDAPASFETPFTALEWKVCFEFVTGQEADADDEEEKEEQQQGRKHIGEERTANDGEEVAQAVAVHEEEEERPRSGQPQQVTPEITSKLRWVFPVRIVPPLDADATDLFLDHGVQKCSTELHV